ncbi:MAG: cell division/cell wall cluster transcriptional repressor MraZ [Rhodospirillales bacterium]
MALLIGTHVNKIDKKGRISVPKPFRDAILAEGSNLYVYPSFKFPAIEASGQEFMQRLTESLYGKDGFSDDHDALAAAILGNAHALTFDPEGRVLMPKELIKHASIKGCALFSGMGRSMQIWEPDAHAAHRRWGAEQARSRGVTLPYIPSPPKGEGS